jgi:hypothetical protein
VSTAAAHADEAMRRIEKFKKLLEVQEALGGNVDLVSPTRELVREGRIVKVSARGGDRQERHLFLFSDLLLLCSARLRRGGVLAAAAGAPMTAHSRPNAFRLRARFLVDQMQVKDVPEGLAFHVHDDHKSIKLCAGYASKSFYHINKSKLSISYLFALTGLWRRRRRGWRPCFRR